VNRFSTPVRTEMHRAPGRTKSLPVVMSNIGLHGSASTWVSNVARELMTGAAGEGRLLAFYAEATSDFPQEYARTGRLLLIKSHHGTPELDSWLAAVEGGRIILSVRDPQDAAISMAQRFQAPLASTVRWLINDCVRLVRLTEPACCYATRTGSLTR